MPGYEGIFAVGTRVEYEGVRGYKGVNIQTRESRIFVLRMILIPSLTLDIDTLANSRY